MGEKNNSKGLGGKRFYFSPLFLIVFTVFVDAIGYGMVFPLLAFYAQTFQAGAVEIGILVASFPLMTLIFAPIFGRISDIVGRKPILVISILTSTLSFMLFAVANSYWILLFSRIVAGVATERGVANAYIADITVKRKRASGIGKLGAAWGAGLIIGPAIAGLLSIFGYAVIGYVATLVTFVNLLFVLFFLPESLKKDMIHSHLSLRFRSDFIQQIKTTFSRSLIRNLLLIKFLFVLAFSALPVVLPLIGNALYEFGPVEISYFFMYIGLIHVIVQGFAIDILTTRFSEEKLISIVLILKAFGMFFIPFSPTIAFFLLFITINSGGTGLGMTFISSLFSKNTSERNQGSVMGIAQSVSSLARAAGPIIAGALFEYTGISAPFVVSAILLVLASSIGCKTFRRINNQK